MSTRTKRTSKELDLKVLQETFPIGERLAEVNGKLVTEKVNLLKPAIENGLVLARMQDCANEMHDGDAAPVYAALRRNIQSLQSDTREKVRNGEYVPTAPSTFVFCEMLLEYITVLQNKLPAKANDPTFAITSGLAKWKLSIEDIDKFDKSDFESFKSIFNVMATAKSRQADQIVKYYWTEIKKDPKGMKADLDLINAGDRDDAEAMKEFGKRYSYVSKLKSAAEKAIKNPQPVVEVSDTLKAKLAKGNNVSLSKAEAAELAALLAKFQK